MAADNSTEILPLLGDDVPHFDIAMRGYDRRQVDEYVARAEAEIADIQTARDSALATSAERAAQLASNAAHIESLKRQAANSTETISPANVSDRIRDMLRLATDEAAQTRRGAEEEAERVLSAAKAAAERVRGEAAAEFQRLTAAAAQRSAEADQKLAQARVEAAAELEQARIEAARLLDEAAAERDRAAAEADSARAEADDAAARRRQIADEDFEITLRTRRTMAERQAAEQRLEAERAAADLIAGTRAQVEALHSERRGIELALHDLHERLVALVDSTGDR
jgi:DivIVA domain-containing protein